VPNDPPGIRRHFHVGNRRHPPGIAGWVNDSTNVKIINGDVFKENN
jgi:hypothetical protein